jgi:hypothetical protein
MICLGCLTFENGTDMLFETSVTIIIRRVTTAAEARNHAYGYMDVTDSVSYITVNRVKTVRIEKASAVEQHLWTEPIQTRQNVRHDQPISNSYWQTRSCLQKANLEAKSCASTTNIRGFLLNWLQKYGFSKKYLKENLVSFTTLRRNNINSCRMTASAVDEVA